MPNDTDKLVGELVAEAPTLYGELSAFAEECLSPLVSRLDSGREELPSFPKTFNDPVWGVIELMPWELVLLDSPLLQRLRGVRQLGMAHHVYPGAGHDRLEHSRGVVEASRRMIDALSRNADHRRKFGQDRDENIPNPSQLDLVSTRLAALLHDIGHGPFSHATENLFRERLAEEFECAEGILRRSFEGVTNISASETIAVILVLSEAMRRVIEHPNLAPVERPFRLVPAIVSRILGSRYGLQASYLSGVLSGPLDADKLDYMARDCYHSGLNVGLDLNRLISKLEVVSVTPDNALNPELRRRAEATGGRFYETGISLTGLGAYEQMIIGRVILYDRLYYHHKVRTAEAMVRRLIKLAEDERGMPFSIRDLLHRVSDDSMIGLLSGHFRAEGFEGGNNQRSRQLGDAIRERDFYHRAFAFAARFIDGLGSLREQEQKDVRAMMWVRVRGDLRNLAGAQDLSEEVFSVAKRLAENIPELRDLGDCLQPEHVIVDLPQDKVVAGGDILTRTQGGQVSTPDFFFDPNKWSHAYQHHKQCGYVYAPRKFQRLLFFASRVVFFEKYRMLVSSAASQLCKTDHEIKRGWLDEAAAAGIISSECLVVLTESQTQLLPFRNDDFELPEPWVSEAPKLPANLADQFNEALPSGLPASVHANVISAIEHLTVFVQMLEANGDLISLEDLDERNLQTRLRQHLRSRQVEVEEGTEIAGGETDLILPGKLVVENKVRGETVQPLEVGANYEWQARRYAIPLCAQICFVIVAYRPKDEAAILRLPDRIRVCNVGQQAEVRICIPWGQGVPSSARAPK